tara:strand:- start:264 stop:1040 length:777 start_codon:yes stop_codon:yes gene_type:complete
MNWFKFFPGDWLADSKVQSMSLEMQGIYIRILCYMWRDSEDATILADPQFIRPLLGVSAQKTRKTLKFFLESEISPLKKVERNGTLFLQSERLLREKTEAINSSEKKRLAGMKGAASRWDKDKKEVRQPHDSANGKTWQYKNKDTRFKEPPYSPPTILGESDVLPESAVVQNRGAKKNGSLAGGKWAEIVQHTDCPNKPETVEMWARRWRAKGVTEEDIIRAFQAHPGSTVIEVDKILSKKDSADSIQRMIRKSIQET